jgi:hypothetical protein
MAIINFYPGIRKIRSDQQPATIDSIHPVDIVILDFVLINRL